MTRKIGDKLTDKNGVKLKIAKEASIEHDPCGGCFYDKIPMSINDCDPVKTDEKTSFSEVHDGIGCFNGGFIFVEDK